jgi:hypothetical protein
LAQDAEGVQTIRFAMDMLKQLWVTIFYRSTGAGTGKKSIEQVRQSKVVRSHFVPYNNMNGTRTDRCALGRDVGSTEFSAVQGRFCALHGVMQL